MAREKDGQRDVYARIVAEAGGDCVSVQACARITGLPAKRVTQAFTGWVGEAKGKYIPAMRLARQLS